MGAGVGEATDGEGALEATGRTRDDDVVLDVLPLKLLLFEAVLLLLILLLLLELLLVFGLLLALGFDCLAAAAAAAADAEGTSECVGAYEKELLVDRALKIPLL